MSVSGTVTADERPAPTVISSKPAAPSPSLASSPASAASPAASPSIGASPKPAVAPSASPSEAAAAIASPSAAPSSRVVNFDAADYSYTLPDTLAAGQVTLAMRNVGKEKTHHAQLLKLNTGVTLDQFTSALQQGEGPALALVSLTGGTGALDPGPNSEEVTLDLQPGTYVVVCFIAGADGVPHVAKGMLKPLQVTAAPPAAASIQPNAPVTIALRDFAFDTPADPLPSGRNTWRITNAGPQPHESRWRG